MRQQVNNVAIILGIISLISFVLSLQAFCFSLRRGRCRVLHGLLIHKNITIPTKNKFPKYRLDPCFFCYCFFTWPSQPPAPASATSTQSTSSAPFMWCCHWRQRCPSHLCAEKFLFMSMGGRADGLACADSVDPHRQERKFLSISVFQAHRLACFLKACFCYWCYHKRHCDKLTHFIIKNLKNQQM